MSGTVNKNLYSGSGSASTGYLAGKKLEKGWLAIAKLKPLSLFISLNIIALESI